LVSDDDEFLTAMLKIKLCQIFNKSKNIFFLTGLALGKKKLILGKNTETFLCTLPATKPSPFRKPGRGNFSPIPSKLEKACRD